MDGGFGQVADNRFHILADIADLGEFCGFDLDERRAREFSQTPRNLCLSDACRADHQDVFGVNFLLHFKIELHPPPAVAQGDRYGFFRGGLADDVTVQLGNDFTR